MNRLWLGVALLVLFLLLGIFTAWYLRDLEASLAEALESAIAYAGGAGEKYLRQAQGIWMDCRHRLSAICDHEPLEEIESLLARAAAFSRPEDRKEFSAICQELLQRLHALTNTQTLRWWNLF